MLNGIGQAGAAPAQQGAVAGNLNPPPQPSPWCAWLPLLILGLGMGAVVAGSVTLVTKLIPRPASLAMLAIGAAGLGGYLAQGYCRRGNQPQIVGNVPPPGSRHPIGNDPFRPRTMGEAFRELLLGAPPPSVIPKPVAGSGKMVTRLVPVSATTEITVHHDDAIVEVVEGPTTTLEVTAEDNVIDLLEPGNHKTTGGLYLASKHKGVIAPTRKIVYRVTLPQVKAVHLLAPPQLSGLPPAPSSTINVGLLCGDYQFVCSIQATPGTVTVKGGKVTSQRVTILGPGQYRAPQLMTQASHVELLADDGSAEVHATQQLSGRILGERTIVRYRGKPADFTINNIHGGKILSAD